MADRAEVIIVDNTHLTHKSYSYYQKIAEMSDYQVAFNVVKPHPEHLSICTQRNTHGVTLEILERMLQAWED